MASHPRAGARLRARLSYANVTATVALFVALGGSAYAATQLPKNSVGSTQIKGNAVTGAKVKNHSLTGRGIQVSCPAGELPIGGGAAAPTSGATGFVALTTSHPTRESGGFGRINGWVAQAIEVNGGSPQSWDLEATVICARF